MRKNDQYKDGHVSVTDNWSRKPACPVGITEIRSSLLPDTGGSSYPIVCKNYLNAIEIARDLFCI